MGAGLFGSMGNFDSAAPERSPARPPDPRSVTESSLGPRFALWQLMGMEGKTLAILVAVPTQQLAVLDVAPYRHCVPSHTYRPRLSVPQTFPATLVGALTAVMLAFLR